MHHVYNFDIYFTTILYIAIRNKDIIITVSTTSEVEAPALLLVPPIYVVVYDISLSVMS